MSLDHEVNRLDQQGGELPLAQVPPDHDVQGYAMAVAPAAPEYAPPTLPPVDLQPTGHNKQHGKTGVVAAVGGGALALLIAGGAVVFSRGNNTPAGEGQPTPTTAPATPEAPSTTLPNLPVAAAPSQFDSMLQFSPLPSGLNRENLQPSSRYTKELDGVALDSPRIKQKYDDLTKALSAETKSPDTQLRGAWGTCLRVDQQMTDKTTGKDVYNTYYMPSPVFVDLGDGYRGYYGDFGDGARLSAVVYQDSNGKVRLTYPSPVGVFTTPDSKDIDVYYQTDVSKTAGNSENGAWQHTGLVASTLPGNKGTNVILGGIVNVGNEAVSHGKDQSICNALQSKLGSFS